jgi:predicted Fe-Mo cluster-binding NifX family protein
MKRKIAVPMADGMLCAHFGHCQQFGIFETAEKDIVNEINVTPPPHEPGLLPGWLAKRGVTDVIAGGMGQRAISLFNQHKINVFVGAPTLTPKTLIKDFLEGNLSVGANYCDH